MAGFLLAYLSIAELQKRRGKMNWVMFIVHRIVRIAPIYYFVLLIFMNLYIPYGGTSPQWPMLDYRYGVVCNDYWWSNLLFVSNFFPTDKPGCMG
jgi:hypothetical protein